MEKSSYIKYAIFVLLKKELIEEFSIVVKKSPRDRSINSTNCSVLKLKLRGCWLNPENVQTYLSPYPHNLLINTIWLFEETGTNLKNFNPFR